MKTIPKSIKFLLSVLIAIILMMAGRQLLSTALLTLSEKTASIVAIFLSSPLLQENIHFAFVVIYYCFGVVLFIIFLRAKKIIKNRYWERRLTRVGLVNTDGESPRLYSVCKHNNKQLSDNGWLVYRFVPIGLSEGDFIKRSARLCGVFRGRVGQCSFTDNMKYIEIEVLPWRAIMPITIQLFDSFEERKAMVDMLGFASLIVGAPNGGKTYCMLTLAANYAAEGYTIIWLNRKGADVEEFRGCANYFEAEEASTGWKKVFERLRRRECHEENEAEKQQKFLLVFDEYQSHVSRLGKEKTVFLNEFASFISMSRSLGFKTLIGTQAAYSEDMPKGARDMFSSTIAMGNLSKTQKSMYYETDIIEQLFPIRKQGGGNIYHMANNSIEKIMVAPMADENAINRLIVDALNRPLY